MHLANDEEEECIWHSLHTRTIAGMHVSSGGGGGGRGGGGGGGKEGKKTCS